MSDQERAEGAKLIEARVREEFKKSGKNVDSITWNKLHNGKLLDIPSHTIHVFVNGQEKTLKGITDETINDYPGEVGNEKINALIRLLANQ